MGNTFEFNLLFQSISAKIQINVSWNCMKNILAYKSLAQPEKISTKLPKTHTFPYRNSEFHTIHDLENGELNSILFQVFHTEYEPWLCIMQTEQSHWSISLWGIIMKYIFIYLAIWPLFTIQNICQDFSICKKSHVITELKV